MRERLSVVRAVWAETLMLIAAAILFLWALLMPLTAIADSEEEALARAYLSGDIVRLHILADGDDAESQRVKLAVRDAVIDAFGDTLARSGAQGSDAAYKALGDNVEAIRAASLECARQNGFAGEVSAEVGVLWLPEKSYGGVYLPEGEYRALRITLGSGRGRNWWCVLFPRLCLAVAGSEDTEDEPEIVWDTVRIWRGWTAMEL